MDILTLNCRGLNCPQPVIQTKDALEQGHSSLEVIVDNEASMGNVSRFGRSRNCTVTVTTLDEGCFKILLEADGEVQKSVFDASEYSCPIPEGKGLVYVISSASMGRGSDELGWALLQTYIQTIKDVDPLPTKIVFYNEGVRLVAEESGALEALRKLQEKGVEIFACGTCLDFFKLTAALKVGQISNMYDIMNSVNSAARVVSPF